MSLPSGTISTVIEDLAAAGQATAIPTTLSSLLSLVGVGKAAGVVDTTKKTVNVAWAQANPTLVPLYMAQGYTIVP